MEVKLVLLAILVSALAVIGLTYRSIHDIGVWVPFYIKPVRAGTS
jgi:hypothetical protein